jgi:copper chaperone CopZ
MRGGEMASVMIDVPAMYADHHVVEVRRILLDVPGVRAVYASSAFGVVEIDFDAEHTSAEALERRLVAADGSGTRA